MTEQQRTPDPPPECPNCDAPLDELTHCCTECDYEPLALEELVFKLDDLL